MLPGIDLLRGERLQGRTGKAPADDMGHDTDKADQPGSVDTKQGIDHGRQQEAAGHGCQLPEAGNGFPDKEALNENIGQANHGKGYAGFACAPAILKAGKQDPDRFQPALHCIGDEQRQRQGQHCRLPDQPAQGCKRIEFANAEIAPLLCGQGFFQKQPAEAKIEKREARRHPEWQADIDLAKQSADCRAQDKAHSKGGTDHAEGRSAILVGGEISHIGIGNGKGCAEYAAQRATGKHPEQARGKCQQQIVEAKPGKGNQHDRSAAEPVRQGTEDRGEDELHDRKDDGNCAIDKCDMRKRAGGQFTYQLRQYRPYQTDTGHVDHDGCQNHQNGAGWQGVELSCRRVRKSARYRRDLDPRGNRSRCPG